ncbi:low molecular weight phosphotyrosine protein phosphatase [Mycolicibacterium smegmatis]|uniref:protein-tyrosine-phosphatase n=1 Tax=Mycolicibacterium smegmatis TaxID=1772 RepID=A0A653FB70_MYCSM|nr:low molecular weight phosphotyrosine protein phosphatase [Mycolicibacterium smegmatis]MBE9623266.1 low molecular weight phosphotyrosine protein phosphatase [Mycolicibacterium smegmatis]MBE9629982.1 low molecular weight phosphotyrosine protein phosphatase [Mycolicibacterium smegmatis]MBE9641897.1 low molecular weight phosphotyrosine protein phosphatase [Mycolicibacterium smegmatis]MBE9648308.1 low molecular weight phosphotyrosine protein phosphatase [Mycolicibacterium smegmatis]
MPTSRPSRHFAGCSVSELHVTFVCSGNICRSPMAEKMFAHQIAERGLRDVVRVTSAGTGSWHAGDGADERACLVLADRGYPTAHRAAVVDDDHLSADLVVAMGRNHARILADLGVEPDRLRMLRSFDPRAGAHTPDVEDPYYGTRDDFEAVFEVIEAALPGLHDWVDEALAARGIVA